MKKYLLFILLSAHSLFTTAQSTDYLKIQKKVKLFDCVVEDPSVLHTSIRKMMAIDTNTIKKNINVLYEDMGMAYYLLSSGDEKEEMLTKSIEVNHKALYHKPNSTRALWNLSLAHLLLGNCTESKAYLSQYKSLTKPKDWDPMHDRQVAERCN